MSETSTDLASEVFNASNELVSAARTVDQAQRLYEKAQVRFKAAVDTLAEYAASREE